MKTRTRNIGIGKTLKYYNRTKSLGEYTYFVGSGPGMTKPSNMTLPMSGVDDVSLTAGSVAVAGVFGLLNIGITALAVYGGYRIYKDLKK